MNLLEKLYEKLNYEQIWGPDGITPLDKKKKGVKGYEF